MFIEVYVIPHSDWAGTTEDAKKDENRRFIELTGIRVRPTTRSESKYTNRAQIVLKHGEIFDVAGSYDEIVSRIKNAIKG